MNVSGITIKMPLEGYKPEEKEQDNMGLYSSQSSNDPYSNTYIHNSVSVNKDKFFALLDKYIFSSNNMSYSSGVSYNTRFMSPIEVRNKVKELFEQCIDNEITYSSHT